MIDFACKRFRLDEVIKCSLNMTKSDVKVMDYLMKNRERKSSQDIASALNLDLSTVQRSLKKLSEKYIIIRNQNNLAGGGYIYFYTLNDKKVVRKIIMDIINNWVKQVEIELEKF